jgi:hypothetical protein
MDRTVPTASGCASRGEALSKWVQVLVRAPLAAEPQSEWGVGSTGTKALPQHHPSSRRLATSAIFIGGRVNRPAASVPERAPRLGELLSTP